MQDLRRVAVAIAACTSACLQLHELQRFASRPRCASIRRGRSSPCVSRFDEAGDLGALGLPVLRQQVAAKAAETSALVAEVHAALDVVAAQRVRLDDVTAEALLAKREWEAASSRVVALRAAAFELQRLLVSDDRRSVEELCDSMLQLAEGR